MSSHLFASAVFARSYCRTSRAIFARYHRTRFTHVFYRTTCSHAIFAHCRLQYIIRRYFRTLFTHAIVACKAIHLLRTIFSQTFVEHYSTTCYCPMPVRTRFRTLRSHVVFSHYFPYATFLASCARYVCMPCRTPFPHATPFSQTLSSPSSSNLSPII